MIFVLDDDLGLTKKVSPCILVPPANSRKTFKTTISNWNLTEMQHHINLLSLVHWRIFYFLSKKCLRQVRNLKIIFTNVISILKVNETVVPKCFQIFSCCTVLPHSYATHSYTIFAAMLFWIGSKKIELTYFLTPSYPICSFFPPVKLFIAHMTRYVSTIRPRSQSALDIVLNKLIIIIRFF